MPPPSRRPLQLLCIPPPNAPPALPIATQAVLRVSYSQRAAPRIWCSQHTLKLYTRNCDKLPKSSQWAPRELPESFQFMSKLFQFRITCQNTYLSSSSSFSLLSSAGFFVWLAACSAMCFCISASVEKFSHILYWQVQHDMQPLHLHCWAIWCHFDLRFSFELSLLLSQFCPS